MDMLEPVFTGVYTIKRKLMHIQCIAYITAVLLTSFYGVIRAEVYV